MAVPELKCIKSELKSVKCEPELDGFTLENNSNENNETIQNDNYFYNTELNLEYHERFPFGFIVLREEQKDGYKRTVICIPPSENGSRAKESVFCTCSECGKTLLNDFTMRRHITIHSRRERPFTCNECRRSFWEKTKLVIHQRAHTGDLPYKCEICEVKYRRKESLNDHLLIHMGIEPFKCEQCDASFVRKGGLRQHMLIHQGNRPYACSGCDRRYSRPGSLTAHLKFVAKYGTHHGAVPTRKPKDKSRFVCEHCGRGFVCRYHLKDHVQIHSKELIHKCRYCDKAFAQKGNLNQHERFHTGDMPYTCDKCGRSYHQRSSIIKHLQKPCEIFIHYICFRCGKQFHITRDLLKHTAAEHKEFSVIVARLCKSIRVPE